MRLTSEQAKQIVEVVHRYIGHDAEIWLFGSRADDRRKGGDIDLYIETRLLDALIPALRCKSALEDIFDQRVDLVINDFTSDKPIYRIAKTKGVKLCPSTSSL